jgi:hypothetical protein
MKTPLQALAQGKMALSAFFADQSRLEQIRGETPKRQVIGSRNARSGRATPKHFSHIGFRIKPVGHLVARRKAALFSAEIGSYSDQLFAGNRIIGRYRVQID